MQEIFKDIVGYEGLYQISNLGRVISFRRTGKRPNKEIKGGENKSGYRYVILAKDKVNKIYLVHRLLAIAFIPNPNNYPIINHKDYDVKNNSLDNLEWCTYRHNSQHGFANKKTTSKYIGVSYNNKTNKWHTAIHKDGKAIYLGQYNNEKIASEVYLLAVQIPTATECKHFSFYIRRSIKICPVINSINMFIARRVIEKNLIPISIQHRQRLFGLNRDNSIMNIS